MKRLLFAVIAICSSLIVWAQSQTIYEVNVNTFLNVRSYASSSAKVLGVVNDGDKVVVQEIKGDWAKIEYNGKSAYVGSRYLKPVKVVPTKDVPQKKKNKTFGGFENSLKNLRGAYNVEWLAILIALLSGILYIIRLLRDDDCLEGNMYVINCALFLLTGTIAIAYFIFADDVIWFCSPSTVGWLWTIIGFIIFAGVAYSQLLCFFDVLCDLQYNGRGYFDHRCGLYSWGALIAGEIIIEMFSINEDYKMYLYIIFFILQLIQIFIILLGIVPRDGITKGLLCVLVYIVGSVSTGLIVTMFIAMAIVVFIALLFLSGIGASSSSSSSKSSSDSEPKDEYTELDVPGEWNTRKVKHYSPSAGYDQYGDRWENNCGTWEKKS